MSLVTTGNFPILSDPRFKEMRKSLKLEAATMAKGPGDKIYRQTTTDAIVWESALMQPVGQMQYIQEGQDPPADQPREDYRVVRGIQMHGLAVEVTQFALEKSERLRNIIVQSLAQSPEQTNESWYQAHYNYSLQGVTVPTIGGRAVVDVFAFDGLSYFNSSHRWMGTNITNSNLSSPARSWSTSAMVSMLQQACAWRTATGQPMQVKATEWIVGDNLIGVAHSYNETEKDPSTNINQKNVARLQNYGSAVPKVVHWSYMGADEFMLRFECPISETYGLCHAFLKSYKARANDYPATNSGRAHVFEVSQAGQVYGDWPYEYITSRAAV